MKKTLLILLGFIFTILFFPVKASSLEPDFYEMFNGHGSIMLLIDNQTGKIEYANRSAADFYGYTIEELESMKISQINTLSTEETSSEMQAAVKEQRNYFIFEHKTASNEIKTVEVFSYPYTFGEREMLFSIIQDITNETILEKKNKMIFIGLIIIIFILIFLLVLLFINYNKLKAKNKEISIFNDLRKTFINADNRLIYLKDENLDYIFINKAVENFYNKKANEIIGIDDFSLTKDKDFAEMKRKTDQGVLKNKTRIIDEIRWDNRIYKTNKFPIKMLNGNYGVGAYIEDITEEYNRQKEREKTLLRNSILVEVFSHNFDSSYEQLDFVLSKALELTDSKFGYIYLYNEEKQEFTLNSWSRGVMDKCKVMDKKFIYQLDKTGLWGEVVRQRKAIIVNDFEKSNPMKKGYPEGHVKLSKFMSLPIIIDNKIVAVIGLANKENDYDNNDIYQVDVLMTGIWNARERREAEEELEKTNNRLNDSKEELQLILDSTAEGIYGLDLKGKCTFCNNSALKLLGYSKQDELLGKDMHDQIHHSYKDGTPMSLEECKIYKAFLEGKGTYVNDEVFWRADGTSFDIEYYSYPQYKEGEVVGAVVTFVDNTERKKREEYIEYLSYHDPLTGLYNRAFFEKEIKKLDNKGNLPISVVYADLNGLKLTNDIFGHDVGDKLLIRTAEILQEVCRKEDIIARVGGDEFALLMINTERATIEKIVDKLRKAFSKEQIAAVKASISLGFATKLFSDEDIEMTISKAESNMYQEKTLNKEKTNSALINTIIETLHKRSPKEEIHSINVSRLCQQIGKAMDLTETEVHKLKEIGYLHDIGKIVLDDEILNKGYFLTEEEEKEMEKHPAIGFRILNLFNETVDLAEGVLNHHENWDGSGYPKGLKGEEIPILARILRVAESYEAMTNSFNKNRKSKEEALREIKSLSGIIYSPEIVDVFMDMMQKK